MNEVNGRPSMDTYPIIAKPQMFEVRNPAEELKDVFIRDRVGEPEAERLEVLLNVRQEGPQHAW